MAIAATISAGCATSTDQVLSEESVDRAPFEIELRVVRSCEQLEPELVSTTELPDDAGIRARLSPEEQERANEGLMRFDADGRPFDEGGHYSSLERWRIGTFEAGKGEVLVMDAGAISVDPLFFIDEANPVSLAAAELDLYFTLGRYVEDSYSDTSGVLLQIPDTSVERWGNLEFAYLTDGASGGFLSGGLILPEIENEGYLDGDWSGTNSTPRFCAATNDRGVIDAILFSNDSGDGAWPMSIGYDADGLPVATHIWHVSAPWRVANPSGTPPSDVTAREEEMLECLRGERKIEEWGYCVSDL